MVGMIDRVKDRNPVYMIVYGEKTKKITGNYEKAMYKINCDLVKRESKRLRNSMKLYNSLNFANGSKIVLTGHDRYILNVKGGEND